MTRVVMFTNTFHPMVGGLERSVANAHEDLNRSGHVCRIVTPRFKGAGHSKDGVLRIPALTGIGQKEFSIPMPTRNRMAHWMEAIEPHIAHSHQPFLLGDTARRVSRQRRIPLVFTHHTLYERYAHYLPVDPERARRLVIEMTTRYANQCQVVIAPTASVRRILAERGVDVPIEIAPSGIDLELYSGGSRARGRAAFGLGPKDEVIGHLGRLSREKNLSYVVEAMLRLMKSRAAVKLLLVGDGDRLEWARARFAEVGLSNRLIAPGMLLGLAAADAYAAMDVFVFASHTDTQGLVLAEAMAAGLPVVALDAPGARDCVIDQTVGRLLAADAHETEFAGAVETLLKNPALLQAISDAARRHSRKYGRGECVTRLLAVYDRALAEQLPQEPSNGGKWEQIAERFDVDWTPFWKRMTGVFRGLASRPAQEEAEPLLNDATCQPGTSMRGP